MTFDKNRILRIIIISIVFATVIFVGQWYYGKNVLETTESALQQKEYISNIDIEKDKDKTMIYVTLKDVDNLMKVYSQILDTIEHQLKDKSFSLIIVNNPGETIENIYNNEIQFIIYEAMQTGEFTQMKTRLDKININLEEVKTKPKIKVFIDEDYLYLQIKHNKSSLYDVIKRDTEK